MALHARACVSSRSGFAGSGGAGFSSATSSKPDPGAAEPLERQRANKGIQTLPASGDTIETDAGWAFFNGNGYLGTVTTEGEVVGEDQFAETE